MSDQDEPQDRRTEGVRIIGAQEAAEAAGRPDVVRRRKGTEKRYGDRPDRPEPKADMPRITISTTEGDATVGGPDEEYPGGYGDPSLPRYGHARLVDDGPTDDIDDGPAMVADDSFDDADPGVPAPDDDRTVAMDQDELDQELDSDDMIEVRWETNVGSGDGGHYEEPPTFEPSYDPSLLQSGPHSRSEFGLDDDGGEAALGGSDDEAMGDDDDSFVLPHWTEPPTGQVPKVVIDDDTDALASYSGQPRWRDEGERSVGADFDDLIDDEPRLGALRGGDHDDFDDIESSDFFSDGPSGSDGFLDDAPAEGAIVEELIEGAPGLAGPRRRRRPQPAPDAAAAPSGDRPLGVAVVVGVGLVALGLICFWLGGLATALLATVIVTAASLEFFSAVRIAGRNPATLLGGVAVAGLMIATYTSATAAYPIVLGLTTIVGLLWFLWVAPGEGAVENLGLTLLGFAWVGVLGSFATLFLGLGRQIEAASSSVTSNPGIGVLIAAILAAVSHDVGAYFSGKHLGKTPMSAASPNKTQEGLIGGIAASVVVTFIVVGIIGIAPIGGNIGRVFIFAVLCALVAPLGDLCESFVKRDLGIKDMGTVLPGHGGILDRFDALLFVLPTAYFVTVLFDVWPGIA